MQYNSNLLISGAKFIKSVFKYLCNEDIFSWVNNTASLNLSALFIEMLYIDGYEIL